VLTYSEDDESFLVKIGVVNVADVFISLITLFLIGKARSGALVELQKFGSLVFDDLIVLFAVGFASAVIAFLLINFLGSRIIRAVTKINYQKLTICCAGFILLINLLFNGFYGLIVCIAGAVISKKAVETGVMKSHCMGVLILPTLINYLLV
jgi:putative membrane protein